MPVGDRVQSRTSLPPQLNEKDRAEQRRKAKDLAPKYRTGMLIPA